MSVFMVDYAPRLPVAGIQECSGPSAQELVRLLDHCDLSNSRCTTPSVSPSPSLLASSSAHTPLAARRPAPRAQQDPPQDHQHQPGEGAPVDFRVARF